MIGVLKVTFVRLLKTAFGFGKAVGEQRAGRKIAVPEGNVGMGLDFSSGYLDRSFKSACPLGGKAPEQIVGTRWVVPPRIGLKPRLEGLVRLFQVSCDLPVVGELDKKLFAVAGSFPELPGSCGALSRQHGLTKTAIAKPQIRVRDRELGIDFYSTAVKRHASVTPGGGCLYSGAVGLESFE